MAVPSTAGVLLSLAALAIFLARQPLKVATDDIRHRRRVARTPVALAIAAGYLLLGTASFVLAWTLAPAPYWLVALPVLPLAVLTMWFDSRGESRQLLPELAGATALGAVAPAAGLAAGWPWPLALALWASALVRVLPAIITVRERVRRLHRESPDLSGPATAHALAMLVAFDSSYAGRMPAAVFAIAAFLAARAAWDLRPGARPDTAIRIGLRELVAGLAAAGAIGAVWAVWVARTS